MVRLYLPEILDIFCSINVLIFAHKLTLKTVDIAYKYIRMSLKSQIKKEVIKIVATQQALLLSPRMKSKNIFGFSQNFQGFFSCFNIET